MATTALRYCVLSLLCRVGFAEMAEQQNCFVVEHDEIELNFSGTSRLPTRSQPRAQSAHTRPLALCSGHASQQQPRWNGARPQ